MILGICIGIIISSIIYFVLLKSKNEENINLKIKIAAQHQIIQNLEENLKKSFNNTETINEKFENIANKILKEKAKDFLIENNTQIGHIINPLKENIKDFREKIEKYYDTETKDKTILKTEIKHLIDLNKKVSEDANSLAYALKGNIKLQGSWGETQLERILEVVGLEKGVHYELQKHFTDDENNKFQPDCIIYLPDEKNLIIDSKVSLLAYEKYFSSTSEEKRNQYLTEHLNSIYNHLENLSKKNYQLLGIKQPDFVFMFIPIESALSLAMHADSNLFEKSLKKNIILCPSSTLISTLRTIAYIWKQEDIKKNFLEIASLGGALYDKMVNFVDDMEKIGTELNKAKEVYDKSMNKLIKSSRKGDTIIGKAEKLKELGSKTSKKFSTKLLEKLDEK